MIQIAPAVDVGCRMPGQIPLPIRLETGHVFEQRGKPLPPAIRVPDDLEPAAGRVNLVDDTDLGRAQELHNDIARPRVALAGLVRRQVGKQRRVVAVGAADILNVVEKAGINQPALMQRHATGPKRSLEVCGDLDAIGDGDPAFRREVETPNPIDLSDMADSASLISDTMAPR